MDLVELKATQGAQRLHPWESARLRFVLQKLCKHLTQDNQVRLLEAGCGDAFVASNIAAAWPRHQVWGYDPMFDSETLQMLQLRHQGVSNLKLIQSLDELEVDTPISIVTLLDVIEHIEDEVSALREIRQHKAVSPKALYLITVPAHQEMFSSHDTFMKHFRRYNKELLQERLSTAGFEVLEIRYFFFSLLLPRWIKVRKEKHKSAQSTRQKGVSAWTGGQFKTIVLKSLLTLDWKLSESLNRVGISLPGLSLYCLCRPAAS